MKIIFLGTPHFAENVLQKLIDSRHQVVACVCQPDKLVGRKQLLEKPPVKVLAEKHNIPVYQFEKISRDGVEVLKALNADIMITAAYGQMLSQEVLDITPFGVFNVHGSVLPKYRGAAPIQWSLINGEKTLGVTILKTQIGMDDGPILHTKEFEIEKTDTVESLYEKISLLGADLLLLSLDEIENKTAVLIPQDESLATKCKLLKKEQAVIDFNKTAKQIENMVRGMAEWPVAHTFINGKMFKVYKAEEVFNDELNGFETLENGTVVVCSAKKGIIIKCEKSFIKLIEVQIEGGKKMDAKSFANGNQLKENYVF